MLVAVIAFGVPPLWQHVRGLSWAYLGCPPATQLRMVTDLEDVASASQLAAAYERDSALDNYGCPTAQLFVYAASSDSLSESLASNGWSDGSEALQGIGPRPDIWLAGTGYEAAAAAAVPGSPVLADRTPVARSPLVLAVPAVVAEGQQEGTWAELFRRFTDQGPGVVRATPTSNRLGLHATALLYPRTETKDAPRLRADIEQRVERSLEQGKFPPDDTPGLLCHRRQLLAPEAVRADPAASERVTATAIIASEQQVIRYNLGQSLGGTCGTGVSPPPAEQRLVALYPADTGDQDLQLVRLAWSPPPQEEAARNFTAWLLADTGRRAITRAGLRPMGQFPLSPPMTVDSGIEPDHVTLGPISAARLNAAAEGYSVAQRPSHLQFLVDTSGSMNTAGPGGSRLQVAARAVLDSLQRIGRNDQFGLWFFPGETENGYSEAVPFGPRDDDTRVESARAELEPGPVPARNTPLYRTMIAGVDSLAAAAEKADPGVSALVVITDGEDTASGISAADAAEQMAGRDVRVAVVSIGEIRCSAPELSLIVRKTAGRCLDADTSDLDTRLAEVVASLRGGG